MKPLRLPSLPPSAPCRRAPLRARALAAALGALALLAAAPARADDWLLSIVEGDAVVIEGARRVAATAGQRPGPGAIVETSSGAGLLRFESADQVSIDLGPDTRAMLVPPQPPVPAGTAARPGRPPQLYLLQGWAKITRNGSAAAAGMRSPGLELGTVGGSVVVQVLRREQIIFAEGGTVEVTERRAGGVALRVTEGQAYRGDGTRRGSVLPRPAPEWLARVPRSFRDPLPLRAAAWRDRRVEPAPLPAPAYAQLADWLAAEPELRFGFTERFAPLARDPDFRRQLFANMAAHPEWHVVLVPPQSSAASGPSDERRGR